LNEGSDDARSAGTPPPVRLPNASLRRRLGALTYEVLLLAALILVVGFLTIPLAGPAPGVGRGPAIPATPGRVLSACLVFVAAGSYFAWSWSGGRRTLPMKTWGLRLERRDGSPVEARTALTRYFAGWIGPAGALAAYLALHPAGLGAHAAWLVAFNFLWAFVDPERQFLHDRVAGTRIVRVPQK
jgi:uncharacterized RDD family membrane protein YckC